MIHSESDIGNEVANEDKMFSQTVPNKQYNKLQLIQPTSFLFSVIFSDPIRFVRVCPRDYPRDTRRYVRCVSMFVNT